MHSVERRMALGGGRDGRIRNVCRSHRPGNAGPARQPERDQLDGTLFTAAPNPSQPSTGTGVFQPFVRIQRSSSNANKPGSDCNGSGNCQPVGGVMVPSENGFNSDAPNGKLNYDTKTGIWTRSVTMSEFEILPGGYIILSLDANQLGKA